MDPLFADNAKWGGVGVEVDGRKDGKEWMKEGMERNTHGNKDGMDGKRDGSGSGIHANNIQLINGMEWNGMDMKETSMRVYPN